MTVISVRPLQQSDHADWRRLWTAYLEFYNTAVTEKVYASTWTRLFDDGEFEPKAMLAIAGGNAVGLVHYMLHRNCWSEKNNCYLQDLYADPEARGTGVGRALIEAVYAEADRLGTANVYWMTDDTNLVAQRLYDRIARRTGFIEYER